MADRTLATSPQVANQLGVSLRTVHRLVAAGRLTPAQKLPGPNGAFLFDPADIDAYRDTKATA